MISSWVARQRGDKVFVSGAMGELTYGELSRVRSDVAGQVVVCPGPTLDSVVDLMTVPGSGRQAVVIGSGLSDDEAARRLEAAREGEGRSALTIVFTSGSTGPAKAVRLTEENWLAAAKASAAHLGHTEDDVWLAAMPLHHVGGLSILYRSAYVGASVRWLPRFEPGGFADALESEVTMASVVPTMLRRVLDFDDRSYDGLRAVLVGGGPIPPGLLEEAYSRGIPALPTYGMTETCAQVATLRPGSGVRYAVEPLPGVGIRIGSGGRIEVRSGQVSPGYADADDRSPDDWFVTPDLGEIGSDGLLVVRGRADDVIVSGGENVDPGEVERELGLHPGVSMVLVTGVADAEWGQRVVALYEGSVEADELLAWARPRLSPWEVPKTIRRVDAVPTDTLGKPDRLAARQILS